MVNNPYIQKQHMAEASIWNKSARSLTRLTIELTERCNNDCIHCCINLPEDSKKAREIELTSDQIKRILSEAADLGCLTVTMTGGEPLLRDDFAELYVFARELGLKVVLFTNATLITPELVALFKRIPPLREIEVTVYGMEKDSYERVTRKKGSFEQAWRGIRLLRENNIPFAVKSVELPQNRKDLKKFRKWAATIPWMPQEAMIYKFFGFRLRRDDQVKNALIRRLRAAPEMIVKEGEHIKEVFLAAIRKFSVDIFKPQENELFCCYGGVHGGCVDAYGNLQLCILLRHPDTVCDIKSGSLRAGFESFMPQVRKIKAGNPEYLNRCGVCFLKIICQQCPGQSWIEHGTLDTPVDYICAITHRKARSIGIIDEAENAWQVRDGKERMIRFAARQEGSPNTGPGDASHCGGLA